MRAFLSELSFFTNVTTCTSRDRHMSDYASQDATVYKQHI